MNTSIALGQINVSGVTFDVKVTEKGEFVADYNGEVYDSESLDGLRRILRDTLLAARVEVPFVSLSGRRGVIRGWHAGNRDLLVTWSNGDKDRLSNYVSVFRDRTDEQVEEIKQTVRTIEEAQAHLRDLQTDQIKANDLLTEAVGTDMTDYNRRDLPVTS